MLAIRDLQLRYRQTLFGMGWAVLQPLAAMLAFSLIFGQAADIPSDGLPYPVFVLAGVVVWIYLSGAVGAAAESLVEHSDLITKVWFPRLLAPAAAAAAAVVDLLVALVLLAVVMAISGIAPPLQSLTLPVWILAAFLIAAGAGFLLAGHECPLPGCPLRASVPSAALALSESGGVSEQPGLRSLELRARAQPGRWGDRRPSLVALGRPGAGR